MRALFVVCVAIAAVSFAFVANAADPHWIAAAPLAVVRGTLFPLAAETSTFDVGVIGDTLVAGGALDELYGLQGSVAYAF